LVADRTDTDTLGCRPSPKLYRGEADASVGKDADNLLHKAVLSLRGEIGFAKFSSLSDTHNSAEVS